MRHWFTVVLVLAVAGLSVWTVLLGRQNRALRVALDERDALLATRAGETGLRVGDQLGPLELFNAAGELVRLDFGPGRAPTLLLLMSTGCEACELTLPLWEGLVSRDLLGARVVAVDASARRPGEITEYSAVFPTLGAEADGAGWLREIPLSPSALVISPIGRVEGVWFGTRAASRVEEIRAALFDASLGG